MEGKDEEDEKLFELSRKGNPKIQVKNSKRSSNIKQNNWSDDKIQSDFLEFEEINDPPDFSIVNQVVKSKKMEKKNKQIQTIQSQNSSTNQNDEAFIRKKLRPAENVLARIKWDVNFKSEEWLIGYEDRFSAIQEIDLKEWEIGLKNELGTIPIHRIRYFKLKGQIMWDRKTKMDRIFSYEDEVNREIPTQVSNKEEEEDKSFLDSEEFQYTPIHKLKKPQPGRKNVILLFNGTFCPIHNNHISMIVLAQNYLETQLNYVVLGGYLSVTHDQACRKKLGSESLAGSHRLAMCELLAKEYDWIMVDKWQTVQKKNPGAQASKDRLKALVKEYIKFKYQWNEEIEILSICGVDLLPKLNKSLTRGRALCIVNRTPGFDLKQYTENLEYPENLIFIYDTQSRELSSTVVRRLLKEGKSIEGLVPVSVQKYHEIHNIHYGGNSPKDLENFVPFIEWGELIHEKPPLYLGGGREADFFKMKWRDKFVATRIFKLQDGKKKLKDLRREIILYHTMNESNSNHVVKCLGANIASSTKPFMVFELANGSVWSLLGRKKDGEQFLAFSQTERKHFPFKFYIKILLDAAKGVESLHKYGIIHRDVKVDNLLVFGNVDLNEAEFGIRVKIGDFGVAKFRKDPQNVIRGHLRHYAPEALEKETQDYYTEKSDIFMFAMLMYELYYCEETWPNQTTKYAIQQTLKGIRPPFHDYSPECYQRVIDFCWQTDPERRPNSSQLVEKLISIFQNESKAILESIVFLDPPKKKNLDLFEKVIQNQSFFKEQN